MIAKSKEKRRKLIQTKQKSRKQRSKQLKLEQKKQLKKLKLYQNSMTFLFLLMMTGCLWFLIFNKAHQVKGYSMEPAIENNDRLFIRKGAEPKRYSLITFDPTGEQKESYVKRVVGMPGDTLWIDNNTLYLNHQMKEETEPPRTNSALSGEELPDGTIKMWVTEEVAKKLYKVKKIPQNGYFVLGDNRNHSTDSRKLGLIAKKQIEGVVIFRYYPFSKLGAIS